MPILGASGLAAPRGGGGVAWRSSGSVSEMVRDVGTQDPTLTAGPCEHSHVGEAPGESTGQSTTHTSAKHPRIQTPPRPPPSSSPRPHACGLPCTQRHTTLCSPPGAHTPTHVHSRLPTHNTHTHMHLCTTRASRPNVSLMVEFQATEEDGLKLHSRAFVHSANVY